MFLWPIWVFAFNFEYYNLIFLMGDTQITKWNCIDISAKFVTVFGKTNWLASKSISMYAQK